MASTAMTGAGAAAEVSGGAEVDQRRARDKATISKRTARRPAKSPMRYVLSAAKVATTGPSPSAPTQPCRQPSTVCAVSERPFSCAAHPGLVFSVVANSEPASGPANVRLTGPSCVTGTGDELARSGPPSLSTSDVGVNASEARTSTWWSPASSSSDGEPQIVAGTSRPAYRSAKEARTDVE
jgi:hypothetical protein